MPDLILIDGGKGQLTAASEVMKELNLAEIPMIGLAKRLKKSSFHIRMNRFYWRATCRSAAFTARPR
jgi:excinuclease UvrABC nuclease subunit